MYWTDTAVLDDKEKVGVCNCVKRNTLKLDMSLTSLDLARK